MTTISSVIQSPPVNRKSIQNSVTVNNSLLSNEEQPNYGLLQQQSSNGKADASSSTPRPPSETVSPHDNTTVVASATSARKISLLDTDTIEPLCMFGPLPEPLHPSKCPLLCCFYGEFDNTVGPMVCCESPVGFMSRDVRIKSFEAQKILSALFAKVKQRQNGWQQQSNEDDDNHEESSSNTSSSPSFCSIFDAMSDYIITGSELADQIICVSTCNIHLMAMSTSISDARYERNSLLFSVGFVLRREEDVVWPFRGPLTTIVSTFKTMELETQFLSSTNRIQRIQSILEAILISLNSQNAEANLILDSSNQINLKLFRPPRALARRVPDYAVPILLVPEWQLQMFDWDLTINWIIPHIDGIKNALLIAKESEMDDEMCAACLRVLKHHGVIDVCDIFRYSNVYESTPLASSLLLSLKDSNSNSNLLDLACYYCSKTAAEDDRRQFTTPTSGALLSSSPVGLDLSQSESTTNKARRAILLSSLSSSPLLQQQYGAKLSSSPSYYHLSTNNLIAASFPPTQPTPLDPIASYESSSYHQQHPNHNVRREQHRMLKRALAHLYCSCAQNMSFGDILLSKLKETNSKDLPSTDEDGNEPIDWKFCFESIEHRRFITFGIIHGVIRRVHCFPFAHATTSLDALDEDKDDENEAKSNGAKNAGDLTCSIGTITTTKDVEDIMSSCNKNYYDSDLATSRPFTSLGDDQEDDKTEVDYDANDCFANENEQDPMVDLANKVAESMDGTRCDDELTCMFSTSLPELVDMVDTFTEKTVSFAYSTMRLV